MAVGDHPVVGAIQGDAKAISVAVAPDGSTAATGHIDKTVRLWDLKGKKESGRITDYPGGVNALAFNHDGKSLATGIEYRTASGYLRMVNVAKKQAAQPVRTDGAVMSLAFAPDDTRLAYGTWGKAIEVPGIAALNVGGNAIGQQGSRAVQPAFAEIEEALVPALIMERHGDGSATVFVPSSPTPTVGSLYVLPARRVHPIDVPIAKFMNCLSGWGLGTKDLLSAMRRET